MFSGPAFWQGFAAPISKCFPVGTLDLQGFFFF
jgi:hypothetical protein